jgi:LPS export ABC transporter protein LptC
MRRTLMLALVAAAALAACRKDATAIVAKVATTADSADQVIYKMRTVLTDRGVQRAELTSDTAYAFDENTRYELRVVSTIFFNKSGEKDGTLTSKRGTFNTRANVMEARDNVVILGIDGKKLTSPMVRFEQFRNLIVSDSPFVMVEGERRLEGIGFESDPQMLNVKVRQMSRGTGASILLPSSKNAAPEFRTNASPPLVLPPATEPAAIIPAPAATPKPSTLVPPSAGVTTPGKAVKP